MKLSSYIIHTFVLACLVSSTCISHLFAQQGIQLSNSPRISLSQWQQPANLALDPFEKFSFGIGGAYGLGGSSLSLSNWPLNDNFLDEGEKEILIADLEEDNRFNILAQADLLFQLKIKKRPYSFGFRQRSLAYSSFQNPDLLGLILKGNAAYTNQLIEDAEVLLSIQSYSEFSAGTAAQRGKLSYGGRLKLLFGNNYRNLDLRNFSLFTSELGTKIELGADFDYDKSKGNRVDGFGAAVDLGVNYQLSDALQLNASLLDIGFISWGVNKTQNRLNTSYEGLFIENINNLDLSDESSIFSSDSLQRLIFPDTTDLNSTVYLPAFAQLGITYQLGDRSSLGALLRYGFSPNAPMSNKAQLSLIYQRHLNSWLKGGIHGSVGGMESLEAGAFLAGNISLRKKRALQVFWQADQLLGLVYPEYGKAQAMQIGIIFKQ